MIGAACEMFKCMYYQNLSSCFCKNIFDVCVMIYENISYYICIMYTCTYSHFKIIPTKFVGSACRYTPCWLITHITLIFLFTSCTILSHRHVLWMFNMPFKCRVGLWKVFGTAASLERRDNEHIIQLLEQNPIWCHSWRGLTPQSYSSLCYNPMQDGPNPLPALPDYHKLLPSMKFICE